MRRPSLLLSLFLSLPLLMPAMRAEAQATPTSSAVDSFDVAIRLLASCNIDAPVPNTIWLGEGGEAGIIPTGQQQTVDGEGTIQVWCTEGTPFRVGLDGGRTANDVTNRQMSPGGQVEQTGRVPYHLSNTSDHTFLWGNDGNAMVQGTGKGLATVIPLPVYVRATLQGDEPSGVFRDTVMATLQF